MTDDSFQALALRVLAGKPDEDDRRALESMLESSISRREQFEEFKVTYDILSTTAPLTEATRATEPELPAWRLNELRTAVRQHFGPEAVRQEKATPFGSWIPAMRWLFAGSGLGAIGFAVVLLCFANRSIEVGLYKTDLSRDGTQALTSNDIPAAQLVTFDQDTPFDQWQSQPLAWNEHAKIWVDNEHDLLHIVQRVRHGQILTTTQPLASTDEGQREQIKQVVESLQK